MASKTVKIIKKLSDVNKQVIMGALRHNKHCSDDEYNKIVTSIASANKLDLPSVFSFANPHRVLKPTQRHGIKYKPHGSSWIHDEQKDDVLTDVHMARQQHFLKLREITSPQQRSPNWFAMRNDKITASDGGCCIDENKYEPQYKFILKKIDTLPFPGAKAMHHGTKYETIATMIYEYRMNVTSEDFGLLGHPEYNFLGASPDGIVGLYKKDGKSLTDKVGRMVEIKCPISRQIIQDEDGSIFEICPKYYWIQVQLQLECCDLEECDFWQCSLGEYDSYDDFIEDTDPVERFRSASHDLEKGCVIQLFEKNNKNPDLFTESSYIYPPHIEMTPEECLEWIDQMKIKVKKDNTHRIDRVLWWYLKKSNCTLIKRDKKWFADNLPKLQQMWNYVRYFRQNTERKELLKEYIACMPKKMNVAIMKCIDVLYNNPDDNCKQIKDIHESLLGRTESGTCVYCHLAKEFNL